MCQKDMKNQMEKIKIAYICEALGGGVRKHLVDLLNHIDKDKYDVHVIHGVNRIDEIFAEAKERLTNVSFYAVAEMEREISFSKDFIAFRKTAKLLKNIKPDIVHCHSSKAGVLGRVAAKYAGVQDIYYTPHGYIIQSPKISTKKKTLFTVIEKVLASTFTSKVVHVSKGEEAEAVKHRILKREKSVIVYNGMNSPRDYQKSTLSEFHIVTIARMDDQKNPWEAIKIVEKLLGEFPNIKYTYVGDGQYLNEIREYVKSKGLGKNIILPGFMNNPYKILEVADLFFLTSLYEGLPYALIEAMAFKVPVLASDVTGNNELVVDAYNGFLYQLHDIEEGSNKLRQLLTSPERLQEMSENAYHHFLDNFTIQKMLQSYDELYSGA